MMYTFDITSDRFRRLDFREGVLAFNPTMVCCSPLSVLAWGVLVNQWAAIESFGPNGDRLPSTVRSNFPCPLYAAGWGMLTLHAVSNVAIRLTPIAPSLEGAMQFLTYDGQQVVIEKKCEIGEPIPADGGQTAARWYDVAAYLEHPYGDLYMSILAGGRVTFEVDLDSFVPFSHYVANAQAYDLDRFRGRQADQFPSHGRASDAKESS